MKNENTKEGYVTINYFVIMWDNGDSAEDWSQEELDETFATEEEAKEWLKNQADHILSANDPEAAEKFELSNDDPIKVLVEEKDGDYILYDGIQEQIENIKSMYEDKDIKKHPFTVWESDGGYLITPYYGSSFYYVSKKSVSVPKVCIDMIKNQ